MIATNMCSNFGGFRCSPPIAFIYAKLSSHVCAIRERESGSKYARNCVYLSKIENRSYH